VIFQDIGLADYKVAWDYQEKLFKQIMDNKLENRELPEEEQHDPLHYLLFCEHPHVYTLGRNGEQEHLLKNQNWLKDQQIDYYKINRGGDITYHGPGQIVGYPIFDLDYFFTDIHRFLRQIEEAIIRTLYEYDIKADRLEGATGVWLDPHHPAKARKICAIGIRCSRWITMHGFAFNVNTDLQYFNYIVPCGINDKAVTSMQQELGKKVDMHEVKVKLKKHLQALFNMQLVEEGQPHLS
jgi:lipoyl(octanoyl) transferase